MTGTIIRARNLTREYALSRGPLRAPFVLTAVAEATFEVKAGTTLAVVGESGCGKSTLARMITMIEPANSGSLEIDGIRVESVQPGQRRYLRRMIQIVFQDPYSSLNPRQKIGAALEEPLAINTSMAKVERRARAADMLDRVGLRPEHYGRYPHMFSGGQRQRIAIARALILEPRILVLDEPVSALDVSIQAQILNLLRDLQQEMGLTYIFISHDLSVVRHVADDVLVMYLGRAMEFGRTDEVLGAPRHPYTRALLSATPIADPSLRRERIRLTGELPSPINPPSGCPFHPRCPYTEDRCRQELPKQITEGAASFACHGVEEGRI